MGYTRKTKEAGTPTPEILSNLENRCPAESLEKASFDRSVKNGWRGKSICSGFTKDQANHLFFEKSGTAISKITCSVCPSNNECLIWALMYNEEGIWGGTSEDERQEYGKTHQGYIASLIERAKKLRSYFPVIIPVPTYKKAPNPQEEIQILDLPVPEEECYYPEAV